MSINLHARFLAGGILGVALLGCTDAAPDTDELGALEQQAQIPTIIASGEDFPVGVIADATRAYWFNAPNFATEPADLRSVAKTGGGTPITLVEDVVDAGVIRQDDTRLYWPMGAVTPFVGGIQSRAKIGGPVTTLLKSLRVFHIIVVGSSIYFVSPDEGGFLGRIPKTGGAVTKIATDLGPGLDNIPMMGLAGDYIAWTQSTFDAECDGRVRIVLKNGGPVTDVATGLCSLFGFDTDATSVYWTDFDPALAIGRLMRLKINPPISLGPVLLDKVDGQAKFIASQPSDPSFVYYSANDGGVDQIRKIPKLFGPRTVLAEDPEITFFVSIDATHVYWTTPLTGEVKRVPR